MGSARAVLEKSTMMLLPSCKVSFYVNENCIIRLKSSLCKKLNGQNGENFATRYLYHISNL